MKQSNYIDIDNGRMFYQSIGNGEAVVFIHGFSLDHNMWNDQTNFLSDKFHTITYDLRGFGKSSNPTMMYTHHDDLKKLLDSQGIAKAHVVGLSLGGGVAVDFALNYPDSTLSLLLADSSLGGFVNTVDWNIPAKEKTVAEAKQTWVDHEVFETTRINRQVLSDLETILKDYDGWHWFNKDMKSKDTPTANHRLNEIVVPTSIIVGEKDLSYFHEIAKVLHDGILGSKLTRIEGVGHMTNMENPVEFNKILLDLLT